MKPKTKSLVINSLAGVEIAEHIKAEIAFEMYDRYLKQYNGTFKSTMQFTEKYARKPLVLTTGMNCFKKDLTNV